MNFDESSHILQVTPLRRCCKTVPVGGFLQCYRWCTSGNFAVLPLINWSVCGLRMTLNIVRIQHQGVSRRFLLVDDVEQLEDIVRMEFAIHPEEHVALATPFAGDKQDVVIVPFHSQQLRLIKESHPSATFDLRVYPALDKSLSMQFTATNSRPVDNSVVLGVNQVIAQYDFNASSIREISFSAGDVIEVIGQYNGDWFRGRIGDQEGYFPANYVEGIERLNHNLFESIDESGGDWQDVEYFNSYANLVIFFLSIIMLARF